MNSGKVPPGWHDPGDHLPWYLPIAPTPTTTQPQPQPTRKQLDLIEALAAQTQPK